MRRAFIGQTSCFSEEGGMPAKKYLVDLTI